MMHTGGPFILATRLVVEYILLIYQIAKIQRELHVLNWTTDQASVAYKISAIQVLAGRPEPLFDEYATLAALE
jgi:hypothetical protein